jgi:hypothetical protein
MPEVKHSVVDDEGFGALGIEGKSFSDRVITISPAPKLTLVLVGDGVDYPVIVELFADPVVPAEVGGKS